MEINRRVAIALIVIGLSGFTVSLAAPNGEAFHARLSAMPADARNRANLAGSGTVSAALTGARLAITGSFDGLRSAATTASLHSAVAAGVRGPSIADLTISKSTTGSVTGSIDLTPDQLANLRKGGMYVQIHSEKAPDGVLWGWFLK